MLTDYLEIHDSGYYRHQNQYVPEQFTVSRRAILVAIPTVAAIAACGMGRTPTADELLVNAVITEKLALLPALVAFPDVASQQQTHIDVLSRFTASAPKPAPSAAIVGTPATALYDMSTRHIGQALSATSADLARILILIAASESVHAQVTA